MISLIARIAIANISPPSMNVRCCCTCPASSGASFSAMCSAALCAMRAPYLNFVNCAGRGHGFETFLACALDSSLHEQGNIENERYVARAENAGSADAVGLSEQPAQGLDDGLRLADETVDD